MKPIEKMGFTGIVSVFAEKKESLMGLVFEKAEIKVAGVCRQGLPVIVALSMGWQEQESTKKT